MTRQTTQAGPGSEFFTRTRFIQPPVAKESLVAWYPFREGTGADITAGDSDFGDSTDYSATVNGASFKPSGGVTDIQTGANSGAFEFDGVDDDLGNVRGIGGNSITILAQINTDSGNSDFARVYSSIVVGSDGGFEIKAESGTNQLEAALDSSSGFAAVNAPYTQPTNGFLQIGLRYDGQTLDIIKDGSVASSVQTTLTAPQNTAQIGHQPGGSGVSRFGGVIDSLRVYNAPLSNSEISQYNQNTAP